MENFIARNKPPENIRHKLDISYRIEDQSIILFEIRPRWDRPEKIMESHIAKATFVKTRDHWKVFWLRGDLKWRSYQPKPTVMTLKEFIKLVEEDKHFCFCLT